MVAWEWTWLLAGHSATHPQTDTAQKTFLEKHWWPIKQFITVGDLVEAAVAAGFRVLAAGESPPELWRLSCCLSAAIWRSMSSSFFLRSTVSSASAGEASSPSSSSRRDARASKSSVAWRKEMRLMILHKNEKKSGTMIWIFILMRLTEHSWNTLEIGLTIRTTIWKICVQSPWYLIFPWKNLINKVIYHIGRQPCCWRWHNKTRRKTLAMILYTLKYENQTIWNGFSGRHTLHDTISRKKS